MRGKKRQPFNQSRQVISNTLPILGASAGLPKNPKQVKRWYEKAQKRCMAPMKKAAHKHLTAGFAMQNTNSLSTKWVNNERMLQHSKFDLDCVPRSFNQALLAGLAHDLREKEFWLLAASEYRTRQEQQIEKIRELTKEFSTLSAGTQARDKIESQLYYLNREIEYLRQCNKFCKTLAHVGIWRVLSLGKDESSVFGKRHVFPGGYEMPGYHASELIFDAIKKLNKQLLEVSSEEIFRARRIVIRQEASIMQHVDPNIQALMKGYLPANSAFARSRQNSKKI